MKPERKLTAARSVVLVGLTGGVVLAAAAPALAANVQIAGVQSPQSPSPGPADPCSDPSATFTMASSLVGCWYEDGGTTT
jgi:hypothetical protein